MKYRLRLIVEAEVESVDTIDKLKQYFTNNPGYITQHMTLQQVEVESMDKPRIEKIEEGEKLVA